ncbi:hypothetical protein O7598_21330 [Micromonospora sp. WMMC241]|uniref:hypothetical protein n=1 Tax=Micromonospora sp. WMMC241 TaxID=3015159 RepID=UPI0022B6A74E|nr:hypothetical protein [Micromonospora sp. WMMC241]MCZ7438964.1 hypothetical protein [Micromonospora sp. WMMC241]
MIRRPIVAATLLTVLVALGGCTAAPDPGEPPATAAPALVAPVPTDGGAARALRDRHAATGRLADLAEKPEHASERLDSDGIACGRPVPLLDRREAASTRVFGTPKGAPAEEFVELAQETVVYPDDATAADAVRRIFDLLEACDRDEEDGQVTAGHSAVDLPTSVGVPGRAVAATMTLPDGTRFPHRYGCLHRGRVTQCVGVWTRSATTTETWFDRAVLATAAGLRAAG